MESSVWNPWHGCRKLSPGCCHCYVYRRDSEFGKDTSIVTKTASFQLPVSKNRQKVYKFNPKDRVAFTCLSSDFFIEEADEWRKEAWKMIKERYDLQFVIITKRIHRFQVSLPEDWGSGYENVCIWCTCENQDRTNYRLPILLDLPIKHRAIIHEPMLEQIDIEPYISTGKIEKVVCGGESGDDVRICDYSWVLNTMTQCVKYGVPFHFKQTGAKFMKEDKLYHIPRKAQMVQAAKAGIDYPGADKT